MESWEQSKLCAAPIQQRRIPTSPQLKRVTFNEAPLRLNFRPVSNRNVQGMRLSQGPYQRPGTAWGTQPGATGFVRGGIYQQRHRFPDQQNFRQLMNQPTSFYLQQMPKCSKCGLLSHSSLSSG